MKTHTLCLLLLLYSVEVFAEADLRVCALAYDFGEFTTLENDGVWQKRVADATKKSNFKIQYFHLPRMRCLKDISQKKYDAVFAIYLSEREAYLTYPRDKQGKINTKKALGEVVYRVYRNKNSKVTWNGELLQGVERPIALQRGVEIGEHLLSGKNIQVSHVEKLDQALVMVNHGRSEVTIVEQSQARTFINKLKLTNIVEEKKAYNSVLVYLAFSPEFYKNHTKSVEAIWAKMSFTQSK